MLLSKSIKGFIGLVQDLSEGRSNLLLAILLKRVCAVLESRSNLLKVEIFDSCNCIADDGFNVVLGEVFCEGCCACEVCDDAFHEVSEGCHDSVALSEGSFARVVDELKSGNHRMRSDFDTEISDASFVIVRLGESEVKKTDGREERRDFVGLCWFEAAYWSWETRPLCSQLHPARRALPLKNKFDVEMYEDVTKLSPSMGKRLPSHFGVSSCFYMSHHQSSMMDGKLMSRTSLHIHFLIARTVVDH